MRIPLPDDFVQSMRQDMGQEEAERLFASLDTEPAVSVRYNPAKPSPMMGDEQVGWCDMGRYLTQRPQFTLDALMHAGVYYVQEASSMFVGYVLRGLPLAGCRVLDMCAAPGGKTTIYSSLVGREGLVVANDINRSRTLALSDNVQRWGMGNVVVTCNEPRHIGAFEHWFDVVAVDAPCSGEGMFRKMDEARSEWSAASVDMCAQRQREILAEAWRALRPGGVLLYSTCTFNSKEDEGVVEWLMEEYGDDIVAVDDVAVDAAWGVVVRRIGAFECFHFYPHLTRGEGFFAAVARKREGSVRRVSPKARRKALAPLRREDAEEAARWVDDAACCAFRQVGDMIYCYDKSVVADVETLCDSLSVVYSGVLMGQVFKRRLKPEHPLALYVGLNESVVPRVELSAEEAVEYLRRGDVPVANFEEGINIVTHKSYPIGFVKRIGGRCNNMYPKEQRVLKR